MLIRHRPLAKLKAVDIHGVHLVVALAVGVHPDHRRNRVALVKSPAVTRAHLSESHPIEIVGNGAIGRVVSIHHHIHRHDQPLPLTADDPSVAVACVLAADADATGVGPANVVRLDRDAAINVPVIHRLPLDDRVVVVPLVQVRDHEIQDHGELVDIGSPAVRRHAVRAQVAARSNGERRIFVTSVFHHLGWLATDVRDAKGGRGAKRSMVLHSCFAGQVPILHVGPQGRAQIALVEIPLASHLVSRGVSDSG